MWLITCVLQHIAAKTDMVKKLKDSSDQSDDDAFDGNLDDEVWEGDDFWGTDPTAEPIPIEPDSGNLVESGVPTPSPGSTDDFFATDDVFGGGGNSTGDLLTARMGDGGLNVDIGTTQFHEKVDEPTILGPTSIKAPKVQLELFPQTLELKAHSSVNLREHDPEFFAETTNFLTPCLQIAYHEQLQAYKLTVDYTEGPDASDIGVVITHIDIHVIVSLVADTIGALKSWTNDHASQVIVECFDGPHLNQFLGTLRREGVEINEIEFKDRPFKSPIFSRTTSAPIVPEEPKKNRTGLIAVLIVLFLAIGAVFLAHRRGKLSDVDLPALRIGHFVKSIRDRLQLGDTMDSMRQRIYHSSSSSQGSRSDDQGMVSGISSSEISSIGSVGGGSHRTSPRERTWSDSFRRYPPSGIRPAALQKKPAYSIDYLATPRSQYSYSVQGDFNVPAEYEFQGTPVSSMSAVHVRNRPNLGVSDASKASASSRTEDAYGLQEDNATASEEISLYSRRTNGTGVQGHNRYPAHPNISPSASQLTFSSRISTPAHPTDMGTNSNHPNGNAMVGLATPTSSVRMNDQSRYDEWSVASFLTSSPPGAPRGNGETPVFLGQVGSGGGNGMTESKLLPSSSTSSSESSSSSPPPPYRDWNDPKSTRKDSLGSRLAMPKLFNR